MNFWERKEINKDLWHTAPNGPIPIAKGEQYLYIDTSGNFFPITFEKNISIERVHSEDKVVKLIVKASINEQLTYKERQKEIEIMMQSVTDGQYLVTDGFTTLYGKRLENYTQKEMYDTLKKLMGE